MQVHIARSHREVEAFDIRSGCPAMFTSLETLAHYLLHPTAIVPDVDNIHIKTYNMRYTFTWDFVKEALNAHKHGYSFQEAMEIFADPHAIHLEDPAHSTHEARYYAVGKSFRGDILTVRYTRRGTTIRIFGVAKWRKWKRFYEKNTRPTKNDTD